MERRRLMQKYICEKLIKIISIMIYVTAFLLIGIRFLGFTPYVITSGSMAPTYKLGSIVYLKKLQPKTIEPQTIISYVLNKDLAVVTHRVIENNQSAQTFKTKGDANIDVDPLLVSYNNVLGKVSFNIPYLGYLVLFIKQKAIRSLIIYITIILVAASIFLRLIVGK